MKKGGSLFRRIEKTTLNVFGPPDSEFKISKRFHISKQSIKKGQQSFWGFPRPEITRVH